MGKIYSKQQNYRQRGRGRFAPQTWLPIKGKEWQGHLPEKGRVIFRKILC